MPVAGQKVSGKATRPWFEDDKIARAVGEAVKAGFDFVKYMKSPLYKKRKVKLTNKEEKQAIDMWNEWRGEVAVKVRDSINRSSHTGFGRAY